MPQAQIELPNGQKLQIIYVETHGYSRAYFNSKRWGLRNEDTALHYWAMVPTYKGKLAQSIEESRFEFDAIVRAPSNSDDVQPYYDVVSKRWPVHDLSKNITRKGMVKASANETTVEDLTDSEFAYMPDGEEPNLRSVLIIDESCSTGKTIAAVQELLWRAGMPKDARVVAAVCCKML